MVVYSQPKKQAQRHVMCRRTELPKDGQIDDMQHKTGRCTIYVHGREQIK